MITLRVAQKLRVLPGKLGNIVSSRKNSNSTINRIKDFVFATEKENFHDDFVKRSHNWDGIDKDKYMLIYRDIGASRSYLLVSTIVPISFLGALYIIWDVSTHERADRSDAVIRLQKDAEDLGALIVLPSIALVLVTALVLRVHRCRLLRIYQDKKSLDDYVAISSKAIVGQEQVKFNRSVASAFYYAEDQGDVLRMALHFLFGNIQIESKKYMVMDDCFRANNFRSYMLNETSVPPRMGGRIS
ncbi:unnamed protein product [Auanema sp. JU1783]|nr:unnamed protein product [Auanema sp. JU1783]